MCGCKPAPENQDIHMDKLAYNSVQYIAATASEPSYVLVEDGLDQYRDYGSPSCDARCQFDSFYIKAYNQSGIVSWQKRGGIKIIDRACSSCTTMPDPLPQESPSSNTSSN